VESPFIEARREPAEEKIQERRKDLQAELSDLSIERIVDNSDPNEVFGGEHEENIDDTEIGKEMKFDHRHEKGDDLGSARSDLDDDEVIIRVDQPPKRPTSLARDFRDSKDFVASL